MAAQCNFTIPSKFCTLETCCLKQAVVDYQPTLAGNATYAGLFGIILLAQTVLLVLHPKTYGFFIGMACGLLLEVIGYIGRILMHNNPFDLNNYIIYLVCLTIAPAFLMASIYVCMGRVVVAYGSHHSLVKPRTLALICVAGDLISLILQSLGGALAATSAKSDTGHGNHLGEHIMVAGLIFQLVSTVVFAVLCIIFAYRCYRNPNVRNEAFIELTAYSRRFKLFLVALSLATLLIFIRSVFRVAELYGGFGSEIANNETLFMIFEGPMLIAATAAITVFHPGVSFKGLWAKANWTFGGKEVCASDAIDEKEMTHFTRAPSEESVNKQGGVQHTAYATREI